MRKAPVFSHAMHNVGSKKGSGRVQQLNCDDSSVFAAVTYDKSAQIATAYFWRGGAGVYDYDLDPQTWKDWKDDPSPGGFFNDEIR